MNSAMCAAGVRLQPDRDHGLDRAAERGRVDVGVVAADHAALAQRPHPAQAGRRRDADPLGRARCSASGRRRRARAAGAGRRRPGRAEHCSATAAIGPRPIELLARHERTLQNLVQAIAWRRRFLHSGRLAGTASRSRHDEGRHPPRGQEPRVPRGDHPVRRARAGPPRPRGLRRAATPASARPSPTTTSSPPARRSSDTADDVWGAADMVLKVKEPIAEEYHRMRKDQVLFTYLHLAADKAVHRRAARRRHHRHRLRDRAAARRLAAAAGADVRGRRPAGARRSAPTTCMRQGGGRGTLMGGVPGVYAAKVVVIGAGVSGQNAAAIALGMQAEVLLLDRNVARLRQMDAIYQGHCQTDRLERLRGRAGRARRRPRHRRGAGPRRQGAEADQQRAGVADEAGLGARRHLHRPGRLLRGLAPDHARRPDLPGARLGLLLRRQHARRGAAHLDLRADQRDAALRRRAGQPRLARRAARATTRSPSA